MTKTGYLIIALGLIAALILSFFLVFIDRPIAPGMKTTGLGILGLGGTTVTGKEAVFTASGDEIARIRVRYNFTSSFSVNNIEVRTFPVQNSTFFFGYDEDNELRVFTFVPVNGTSVLFEVLPDNIDGLTYETYEMTERNYFFSEVMYMGIIFGIVYGGYVILSLIAVFVLLSKFAKPDYNVKTMKFVSLIVFYGFFMVLVSTAYLVVISLMYRWEYNTQYYFMLVPLIVSLITIIRIKKKHKLLIKTDQSETAEDSEADVITE